MKKIDRIFLFAAGIFNIIFGSFHLMFHKIFNWEVELQKLSVINSNIMQMLNYCIAVFFLMIGIVFLVYHKDILSTRLGKSLLALMSVIFAVRLVLEFALPGGSMVLGAILLLNILFYAIPMAGHKNQETIKSFSH